MSRPLSVRTVFVLLILLACASVAQAQAPPSVTIQLVNSPPNDLLELGVGDSYTADILVISDQPFLLAMVLPDQYYPGRGIFVRGGDHALRNTTATLHVTITGKASTADLETVCDWPEADGCWPYGGVAPVSLAVGVRFKGGYVTGQRFDFAVAVP